MNLDHKIIGIAGNARSGKDTLADNLVKILSSHGIKARKLSFANELKESVNSFLIEKTGISAFTEDEREKSLIRPFLVCWGTEIMRSINNNIWVENLQKNLLDTQVNIITDVRFVNELEWVKQNKGLSIMIKREGNDPANSYEETNNKKLSLMVDNSFNMLDTKDSKMLEMAANEVLNSTINNKIFELLKATCPL